MMSRLNLRIGSARLIGTAGLAGLLVLLACETRGPLAIAEQRGDTAAKIPLARAGGIALSGCAPAYFVDGELFGTAGPGGAAPAGIEALDIKRIEVIKGADAAAQLASYPGLDSSCGVIHLYTKSDSTVSANAHERIERRPESVIPPPGR